MRTIVIGDVHGCLSELEELLMKLRVGSADRVVMLGDFMDRGPAPAGVVRLVRESGFLSVMGNHDEKHCRWRAHHERQISGGKKNPIKFKPEQVTQNLCLSEEDVEWMRALPMSIDLGSGWHAIHAGLEPCKTFEEQKDSPALMRTRFIEEDGTAYKSKDANANDPTDKWYWSERWRGPESVVYGHHIHRFLGPRVDEKRNLFDGGATIRRVTCVGLDTGCYAGGRLSAMILRDDGSYVFEHVDALRVYASLSEKYGPNRPEPLTRASGS